MSECFMPNGLSTARTVLRKFEKTDLGNLYAYCSQDGVGEAAGWPRHESIEHSAKILDEYIEMRNQFAIIYKENGKVVGHIGVQDDSENGREDTKELGYVLNRDYWNRGIMTEVVLAVLDYLFLNGVEYVYACCFQNNAASKHLIEKCGFAFERNGSYYAEQLDKSFDSYEYVFSREQWSESGKA